MDIKFDFTGKNALITGSATGIGKEIALQFAKAGANVAIVDFNEAEGAKACQECKDIGVKSAFFKVDIAEPQSVNEMAKQALSEFGHFDFYISNAGRGAMVNGNPITNIPAEEMVKNFKVNVTGFTNLVSAFYDQFKTRKQGKIVCTASLAIFTDSVRIPHYTASKKAVYSFVRAMAIELGQYNINVNAIAPGFVYTPIYHQAIKIKDRYPELYKDCKTSEDVMNKMGSASALGRAQSTTDMAYGVMFLCSEGAKEITGHCLLIDSGYELLH